MSVKLKTLSFAMRMFSYIKILSFCFLLQLTLSCKEKKEELIIENKLEISFKGYYEEFYGYAYVDDVYTDIEFNHYSEELSPEESVRLIQVVAKSADTDKFVRFVAYADSLGENVLFEDMFVFKSTGGASYYPSELYFNVIKNDNIGFEADFSGALKHYNQYEYYYFYMNIKFGHVSIIF